MATGASDAFTAYIVHNLCCRQNRRLDCLELVACISSHLGAAIGYIHPISALAMAGCNKIIKWRRYYMREIFAKERPAKRVRKTQQAR